MLSQIYLGKTFLSGQEIDLHQHATVRCSMSKLVARFVASLKRLTA